jgi:hypothetical protein
MHRRVEVSSGWGVVIVRDAGVELPAADDQDALIDRLRPLATTGKVFFLAADDPVRFRIDVYVDERPTAHAGREFEPVGGSFLLHAPTGHLIVSDSEPAAGDAAAPGSALLVQPGRYVLTLMGRRSFSGARHAESMIAVMGKSDWTFTQRVDRSGLLGCLPIVIALVCAVIPRLRWLLWYVLPVLVVSWLPYVVLRHTGRYKNAQQLAQEHENSMPHHIVIMTPTDLEGLEGGFLRV